MAFEVVSESDTARHSNEKVSQYLANGAAEVWLIFAPGPARSIADRWLRFRPPRGPLPSTAGCPRESIPTEQNALTRWPQ